MTAFLIAYYVLVSIIVAPVLVMAEVCEWSEEQTTRILWAVLTVRVA